MKKTKYIRFAPDGRGARIGINQKPPGDGPLLVDPDLSRVQGIPPESWELVNNAVSPPGTPRTRIQLPPLTPRLSFLTGALIGIALAKLITWLT